MSNSQSSTNEVLKATVPDVRPFAALLRGVAISDRANMTITDSGLVITVEESRTVLGITVINRDLFDEFVYGPELNSEGDPLEETNIEFPLNTFIECLNIFGTGLGSATAGANPMASNKRRWKRDAEGFDGEGNTPHDMNGENSSPKSNRLDRYFLTGGDSKGTGMRLTYAGTGHPITLLLAEDAKGPTTTCEITTFDIEDDQLQLPFGSSPPVMKAILKSSWFRDALTEVDASSEKITFVGYPLMSSNGDMGDKTQPLMQIRTTGTFGDSEMDFPNDPEVLEVYECRETVSFSYRFERITRALKVLQNSERTALRINREGLLSMQFMTHSISPKGNIPLQSITEFKWLPLDDDDVDT